MRLLLAIMLLGSTVVSAQTNRPLAAVNTIADLVTRNSVNNERVVVAGWVTPGDWGAERIMRHDPASVLATNLGCVFDSDTVGRYIADDCASGQVNIRWWGGTNDVTALAAALSHILSRPTVVEIVDRAVWLADGEAPMAAPGTMALYSTNLSGVHELGIAYGGGSNNIVATKDWIYSLLGLPSDPLAPYALSFGSNTWTRSITASGTYPTVEWTKTNVASLINYRDLGYAGTTWRLAIGGIVTVDGNEIPLLYWTKVSFPTTAYYNDITYLSETWRSSIASVVVVNGVEVPIIQYLKL